MLPVLLPLCCSLLSRFSRMTIQSFSNRFRENQVHNAPRTYNFHPPLDKKIFPCPSHSLGQEKPVNASTKRVLSSPGLQPTQRRKIHVSQLVAEIGWFHCKNCQTKIQMSSSFDACLCDRRFVTNSRSGHSHKILHFAKHTSEQCESNLITRCCLTV